MSEPYARRSRRPDSRQMWDEADSRSRPSDRNRDGGRERDRPRESNRAPRDQQHDDRDDRPRGDRRRYRSRSRSRDRQPAGDRDASGRGGRDRPREERHNNRPRDGRRREGDEPRPDFSRDRPAAREREDRREEEAPRPDFSKDRNRRRSASPARSPARAPPPPAHDEGADDNGNDDDDAYLDPLPTRTKTDHRKQAMSFRVGRADSPRDSTERDEPRGRSASRDGMELDDGEGDDDDDEDPVVEDDGLSDMQAMMGFGGFGTTKGKKVAGNNVGAVRKEKKTVYRQYMNRTNGFNRPLSPPR